MRILTWALNNFREVYWRRYTGGFRKEYRGNHKGYFGRILGGKNLKWLKNNTNFQKVKLFTLYLSGNAT